MKKSDPCQPLHLTCEEARLLIIAAGSRLEHMVKAHAAGAITGEELQRRMDMWKRILAKLDKCIGAT